MSGRTVTRLAARCRRLWDRRPMKPARAARARLIAVLVLPLAGGCGALEEMSGPERAWQALHLVDVAQTLNGPAADPCYHESAFPTRQLIGEQPTPAAVLAWGAGLAVAHYFAGRWLDRAELPDAAKFVIRSVDLTYKGLTVGRNHDQGIRPFGDNEPCARIAPPAFDPDAEPWR